MRFFISVAAAFAATVTFAAPAQAQVYNGVFSGSVTSGTDVSGYFTGVAGSSLDGRAISGTFRYDATQASSGAAGEYTGDSSGGFLSFAITVAGTSYGFGSFVADLDDLGSITVVNAPDSFNLLGIRSSSAGAYESILFGLLPTSALSGTGLQGFGGATGSGLFQLDTGTALADASFDISSASATLQVTAVPELATWLQMIGGLGLAGTMLRRRRHAVALRSACAST